MTILKRIKKVSEEKSKKISKIIKPDSDQKKYRIDFFKTGKTKNMGLYEGKKLLIAGEYNFYGIYQKKSGMWIWASSIPGVDMKHINNIMKMRECSYLFEGNDDKMIMFYYQLLTQDSLYITDMKMLDNINSLILYLSDDYYYFNPINSEDNIQFLTLTNIKEKYLG